MADKKELLEAALFMAKDPLMIDEIGRILGIGSLGLVKKMLEDLKRDYSKGGIEVVQLPGGWQMQVRAEHLPHVAHLTPYSDIKEGSKRTLAIVIYKEPIKQSEIIRMQGNKAYLYIKILVKKGLITAEKQGRTRILKTTKDLEDYFGMSRADIKQRLVEGMKAQQTADKTKEKTEKVDEVSEVVVEEEPEKGKKHKKKGKKHKKEKHKPVKEFKDVEFSKEDVDSLRELSLDDFEKN